MSTNSFGTREHLQVEDTRYQIDRLDRVKTAHGLPNSLKVLLENLLGNEDGGPVTREQSRRWQTATAGHATAGNPVHALAIRRADLLFVLARHVAGPAAALAPQIELERRETDMTTSTDTRVSPEGLVSLASPYPVAEILDRLEAVLRANGVTIFARIDHAAAAADAGLSMRPTQLLIFGNPKIGTPVMKAAPTVAIDLPFKALAWEDAAGQVWLSYNSATYLAHRHQIDERIAETLTAIANPIAAALQPDTQIPVPHPGGST